MVRAGIPIHAFERRARGIDSAGSTEKVNIVGTFAHEASVP